MQLLDCVRNTIEQQGLLATGEAVVVGVSGGPDSLCLLHLLMRLRQEYSLLLHVAHLNHCLRGAEADADAQFVSALAERWELPATIESQDVAALAKARRSAIEEAARQARYAFLSRVATSVGAHRIAVGHNADDQVETVLMHWLRGSGLAGLRGMLPLSKLHDLRLGDPGFVLDTEQRDLILIRPLLDVPRTEIEGYCVEHGLRPRFDRSNLDTTHYRNRIRHELLPTLETFNPRVREVILRSSSIIAADYTLLRQMAARAWAEVTVSESEQAVTFDLVKWRALPLSQQRSVLRQAIHILRTSLRNIDWVHVENAIAVLRVGETGAAATLPRGLGAVIGYDKLLIADKGYAEPLPDLPWLFGGQVEISIPGETRLPRSDWSLAARLLPRSDVSRTTLHHAQPWQAFLDYDVSGSELQLRTRHTGDRFWPHGLGDKTTTVNNFMITAKIPRAWRDHLPLLVSSSQVLWVPGWRIDERAKVKDSTQQVLSLAFTKGSRQEA
jgi:tRNA(Ile)-lysidine synthase